MSKENLFRLLKREELIIWAGAGMSKYAGYPDGNSLREIILNDLGPKGQKQVSPSATLMDVADAHIEQRGGSRRDLIFLINRIFKADPTNIRTHEELSLIPQIRTIITTNYDRLFETAYGRKAQSFYKSSQVTQLDKSLVQVYKAHGDLDDPDSIVLTRSDYKDFLGKDVQHNSFWTIIKERLINNSVLFIGYGLEDLNTGMIIGKVFDELKQNRRECFVCAPGLPQYKINELIRNGIQYIDSTGETLVSEMLLHLKDNILSAAANASDVGNLSTVSKFLGNFNIGSTTVSAGSDSRISSVYPVNKDTIGTLKFTTKSGSQFDKQLREFMTRPGSKPLSFKNSEVEDFEFRLSDIKIPVDPSTFMMGVVPNIKEMVTIRFDGGFEYPDIDLKIYGSETGAESEAKLRGGDVRVSWLRENIKGSDFTTGFTFVHHKVSRSLREEIELFTFLTKLLDGTPFTIFTSKGAIRSVSRISKLEHDDFADYLTIFETLKVIENHYGLIFKDFEFHSIDDHTIDLINRVVSRMNDAKYSEIWEGSIDVRAYNGALESKDIEPLIKGKKGTQITMRGNFEQKIAFLGQTINLGYPIMEILNPRISNLKDYLRDHATPLKIESATNQRNIYYCDRYEGPDPKNSDFVILMGVPKNK